jgi:hypothetical protein
MRKTLPSAGRLRRRLDKLKHLFAYMRASGGETLV